MSSSGTDMKISMEDTFDSLPSSDVSLSVEISMPSTVAVVANWFRRISATSTARLMALPLALITTVPSLSLIWRSAART